MASLSAREIATVARNAGFPESEIKTAVAVALAESSGNPSARNASSATGLWQILVKAHPDLASKYNLTDPNQNGKAAYEVWKAAGGKWTPWTTYTGGSYKKYLNEDVSPIESVPRDSTNDVWQQGVTTSPLISQLGFVGSAAFWKRFGIGLLGAALIIAGLIIVFRRDITSVATSVATKGIVNLPKE